MQAFVLQGWETGKLLEVSTPESLGGTGGRCDADHRARVAVNKPRERK